LTKETGAPQPRVAVVMPGVLPEQLALWKACNERNSAITIVGSDKNVYEGRWPWQPRKPTDLETVLLRPFTPHRLLVRGPVWWFYRALGAALREIKPDLIHVISEPWGGLVIQTLVARRLSGLSTRVCVHGADNIYRHGSQIEQSVRRLILSRVLPRLDGFVSWSREGVELARQAGLRRVPTAVIPAIVPDPGEFHPVAAESRRELRAKLGLPTEQPVVGFVGRLAPEKGIMDLIEAFRSIGEPAPFLAVWGSGPLAGDVELRFRKEGIRGRYFGPLGLEEVSSAYQACDVIAVPSRTTESLKEQFGRVVVEAMLAGSVVVAYRTGALPEVVGDGGVLVDEADVGALRTAIRGLIDHPQARSRLALRGRRSVLNRYHPAVLSDRIASFWTEVLSR
jgi:glycosyltransferase involved in cell wall biosynthesis